MKFIEKYAGEEVRGLSMKVPYSHLMLLGKVETRVKGTEYRGWVLICTSKTEYTYPEVKAISGLFATQIGEYMNGRNPELGNAIAIGKLVSVDKLRMGDSYPQTFVDVPNQPKQLYGYTFEGVSRIKPFPVSGKLGVFPLDDEIINQIEFCDE
jgi:hypothetical protein